MVGWRSAGTDLAPLWARLFTVKGIVENYLGNRESAIEHYDRAFEVFRQLEDYSGFSYLMLRALDTDGIYLEEYDQFQCEAIHHKSKSGDLFNTAYLLFMHCMVVAYHLG